VQLAFNAAAGLVNVFEVLQVLNRIPVEYLENKTSFELSQKCFYPFLFKIFYYRVFLEAHGYDCFFQKNDAQRDCGIQVAVTILINDRNVNEYKELIIVMLYSGAFLFIKCGTEVLIVYGQGTAA
jgi:hypothetical protein